LSKATSKESKLSTSLVKPASKDENDVEKVECSTQTGKKIADEMQKKNKKK